MITTTRSQRILHYMNESVLHHVVTFIKGRRTTIEVCGDGYRKIGDSCKKMSPLEIQHLRKGHKKASHKNKLHQASIQRKRLHSLLRREASGY